MDYLPSRLITRFQLQSITRVWKINAPQQKSMKYPEKQQNISANSKINSCLSYPCGVEIAYSLWLSISLSVSHSLPRVLHSFAFPFHSHFLHPSLSLCLCISLSWSLSLISVCMSVCLSVSICFFVYLLLISDSLHLYLKKNKEVLTFNFCVLTAPGICSTGRDLASLQTFIQPRLMTAGTGNTSALWVLSTARRRARVAWRHAPMLSYWDAQIPKRQRCHICLGSQRFLQKFFFLRVKTWKNFQNLSHD